MNNDPKLKPCPFCGNEPHFFTEPAEHNDFACAYIMCGKCGAKQKNILMRKIDFEYIKEILADRWNRREG